LPGIYALHLHKRKTKGRVQVQVVTQIWPFVPVSVL
jgi:hypothetical protein